MSVTRNVTLKCDICGREKTFVEGHHSEVMWSHSVWVRVTSTELTKPILTPCELDVCDDCMRRQTVLEADADGDNVIVNIRNVRFSPVIERERRFLDAVDSMPEEGGSL